MEFMFLVISLRRWKMEKKNLVLFLAFFSVMVGTQESVASQPQQEVQQKSMGRWDRFKNRMRRLFHGQSAQPMVQAEQPTEVVGVEVCFDAAPVVAQTAQAQEAADLRVEQELCVATAQAQEESDRERREWLETEGYPVAESVRNRMPYRTVSQEADTRSLEATQAHQSRFSGRPLYELPEDVLDRVSLREESALHRNNNVRRQLSDDSDDFDYTVVRRQFSDDSGY